MKEVEWRWEIERNAVSLESCSLGEGEFGRVVKATLTTPDSATGTTVAVKMLKGMIHHQLSVCLSVSLSVCLYLSVVILANTLIIAIL